MQLERSSPLTLIEVTSQVIACTYLNEFGKHFIFYFKDKDWIAVVVRLTLL